MLFPLAYVCTEEGDVRERKKKEISEESRDGKEKKSRW